jgi:hypothetical protein
VHATFGIKFNYGKRVKNNIYSPKQNSNNEED